MVPGRKKGAKRESVADMALADLARLLARHAARNCVAAAPSSISPAAISSLPQPTPTSQNLGDHHE